MTLIDDLAAHPTLFVAVVFLFSLLIGSFLNVMIYRLPIMMEREWRSEATRLLEEPPNPAIQKLPADAKYNLVVPRSACPHCNAPITALQNIPVLSFFLLRGKCAKCRTKISARYPIVEVITAVTSAYVAYKFGFTWYTAAALVMTFCLIALWLIDFDTQLLPDQITLPLVWIGLLMSVFATPGTPFAPDMKSSIIGGAAGYLSLRAVYQVFKLLTGKEGMGFGDFKLLAAFGTWFGWQPLLLIVLLSSFAGAVIGVGLIIFKGRDHNIPIPYGPYLAIAGWIAMLWGNDIIHAYFSMMRIGQ
ncbi:MAG TPA: A24 family peptidase [Steroidobacteraceae bacterium]|nr:A24 family peptidase [Steroidobacteraceae bacterium]